MAAVAAYLGRLRMDHETALAAVAAALAVMPETPETPETPEQRELRRLITAFLLLADRHTHLPFQLMGRL